MTYIHPHPKVSSFQTNSIVHHLYERFIHLYTESEFPVYQVYCSQICGRTMEEHVPMLLNLLRDDSPCNCFHVWSWIIDFISTALSSMILLLAHPDRELFAILTKHYHNHTVHYRSLHNSIVHHAYFSSLHHLQSQYIQNSYIHFGPSICLMSRGTSSPLFYSSCSSVILFCFSSE